MPAAVEILFAGGFGVGETTMAGAVGEMEPSCTEEYPAAVSVGVDDGGREERTGRGRVSAIAALAEDRVIGSAGGGLPWHLPEDSRRFRAMTAGHPLIMGRVTFEEFEEPLEDALNIVVTRDRGYRVPSGCAVVHSLGEALEAAHRVDRDEIFIGGGAALYRSALAFCDRLYLTLVHAQFEGSARFPDYSRFNRVIRRSSHGDGTYRYDFVTLET